MSRRGAVRVNPVTGKMERLSEADMEGKHRDGCMIVDDKYVNAARDLGLGGQQGMYDHVKSLVRMRAGDVPTGSSMEREPPRGGRAGGGGGGGARGQKLGSGSGGGGGSAAPGHPQGGRVDVQNTAAVADVIRTSVTTVGRARVAGFASRVPGHSASSRLHLHKDAFQRQRGVVNTLGGAKDVNRAPSQQQSTLPPKGSGARIASFDTLETNGAAGQARTAHRAKRDAANAARGRFPQLHGAGVHVLVPGRDRLAR